METTFKVGDSVIIRSDPARSWLVIDVIGRVSRHPSDHVGETWYRVTNAHGHEMKIPESSLRKAPENASP